jgi:1,2-diacylglycerol 3-alpha-glucosyltransferase
MKIALLTPTFSGFSGIDRVVELDAEDYIDKGNEVTIFTFKADLKPKRAKLIELGMPKNPFLERIYRLFFFLDFLKINKYGKLLKAYDKVISHFYPMNWLAIYAKKHYNIKYIYYNHGIAYPQLFRNFFERIYMAFFRFFANYTAKKADYAVSISKFLRDKLKKEIGLNSKVIYNSIDKKRFHPGIDGAKVRKKYGIKDKDPVLLYVGRISPHKGIDLLIKSFNLILKENPNAKLLIVGKQTFDDYTEELKRLARKINEKVIIFTDFISDKELPYYYATCNVYTTATLWEGYDLPVVEAQACGKPVVAFDLCSHPEVVKNGILVKPKDIEEFAKAILKILK